MRALETWTIAGLPDKPSAWLFRVAHNELMGELRQRTSRRRILQQNAREDFGTPDDGPEVFLPEEMRDDLLRMLFVCCDESIPVESQLVLALKTLCGFTTREIAIRLFSSEANVYKRLGRARNRLRTLPPGPGELDDEQYSSRLPAAGLAVLNGFEPPMWLAGSYLWAAILADLHRRAGNADVAQRYLDDAFKEAPTRAVQELLRRRLRTGGAGSNPARPVPKDNVSVPW